MLDHLSLTRTHLSIATMAVLIACSPSDFDPHLQDDPNNACDGEESDGACAGDDAGRDGPPLDGGREDAGRADADAHEAAPRDDDACTICGADAESDGDGAAEVADAGEGDAESAPADATVDDASAPLCPLGNPVCDPGEFGMEMRGCGACGGGMQLRTRRCANDGCSWGEWSSWSACTGSGSECLPGEAQREMRACGNCGKGMQTRKRSCAAATCSWGAWSAWGECSAVATECTPMQVETETRACGACDTGKQTRSRSCSSTSCSWEGWSAWSACSGVTAACSPGATTACSPADSCGHRVCSNSCTWGACVPRVAGGCLRRRNGSQEEGSNFRCCGDGRWQFCMPSCQWSTDCAACSPDFCEC